MDTINKTFMWDAHTWYLSQAPQAYPCKFFLAGVNFYRFNAKNWQFTVYFAVITQKIGNFLCILSWFTRFLGVNFILQKFCQCKKNGKYQVCTLLFNISTYNDKISESFDCIRLCFNAICEYFVIKTVQVPPQNPTALSSFRLTTYKSPQTANKRKLLSILITLRNRYWFHQISTISCFMR